MNFLGIDPGTTVTGFGVLSMDGNSLRWNHSGTICPPRSASLPEKLEVIYNGLVEQIAAFDIGCVCVEKAFYAKNANTALVLGHARGVILLAARQAGAHILEYTPREIKKAVVGSGAASKEQVHYMITTLLNPGLEHSQLDAYDALGAALCGALRYCPTAQPQR